MAERFCNYCRKETKTVEEDCVDCGLSKPHQTKFVIVTATKEQLHEIGICSDATFKYLLNGKVKEITEENWNAYGRRMFYLKGENDSEHSKAWLWVYEDMCADVTKEMFQAQHELKERLQPFVGQTVNSETRKEVFNTLSEYVEEKVGV